MSVPREISGVPGRKPALIYLRTIGMHEGSRSEISAVRTGAIHLKGLSFEMLRERVPHGGIEVQHRALFVLRVAHGDRGGRRAHLDAIALTAGVAGYTPARDRLVAHSSL